MFESVAIYRQKKIADLYRELKKNPRCIIELSEQEFFEIYKNTFTAATEKT